MIKEGAIVAAVKSGYIFNIKKTTKQ